MQKILLQRLSQEFALFVVDSDSYIPRFVNDRKLIVALLIHDLKCLVDRQRWRDAERGAQIHRRHFLVVPPGKCQEVFFELGSQTANVSSTTGRPSSL